MTATADHHRAEVLNALLADVGAAVEMVDAQGVIRACSAAGARLRGRTVDQVVGANLASLMPEPAAAERINLIRAVLESGRTAVLSERRQGHFARTVYRRVRTDRGDQVLASTYFGGHGPSAMLDHQNITPVVAVHDEPGELAKLTSKELTVLRKLAEGMTHEQIAQKLNRSAKTVEWHRSSIGRKLGLNTVVDLTRFAVERGVLSFYQPDDTAPARPRRVGSER